MYENNIQKKDIVIECFIKNQKNLFLTAITITQNQYLAEDALQEAFIKIIKKYNQLQDVVYAKTWVTRIVINECKDILRNTKLVQVDNDEMKNMLFKDFDDEELQFYNIIRNLCIKDKEIITLKFFHGYNLNEISSILKIPISTAKSRLYRALEKIKIDWSV